MRQATAHQMKRRHIKPLRAVPKQGTRLRELFDRFQASKGAPIDYLTCGGHGAPIDQLRNYYGLDIRCVRQGRWLLAGEWDGRAYIDYVAERMEAGR